MNKTIALDTENFAEQKAENLFERYKKGEKKCLPPLMDMYLEEMRAENPGSFYKIYRHVDFENNPSSGYVLEAATPEQTIYDDEYNDAVYSLSLWVFDDVYKSEEGVLFVFEMNNEREYDSLPDWAEDQKEETRKYGSPLEETR